MAYKDEVLKEYYKYCETCGKKFYKKKYSSYKEWGKARFCSWGCRRGKSQLVDVKPKYCLVCGKEFSKVAGIEYKHWKRRKYCSNRCRINYKPGTIYCITCGKSIVYGKPSHPFCSSDCKTKNDNLPDRGKANLV